MSFLCTKTLSFSGLWEGVSQAIWCAELSYLSHGNYCTCSMRLAVIFKLENVNLCLFVCVYQYLGLKLYN